MCRGQLCYLHLNALNRNKRDEERREREKTFLSAWGNKTAPRISPLAPLHWNHLCVLGERSEGATMQLTARGLAPKALGEPALVCAPPQSCMLRPRGLGRRGPHGAAASQGPAVTTRRLRGHRALPAACKRTEL